MKKRNPLQPITQDELARRDREELSSLSMTLARMSRDQRLVLSGFAGGLLTAAPLADIVTAIPLSPETA